MPSDRHIFNYFIKSFSIFSLEILLYNDEDAVPQLLELQQAYPGAEIYVNGELTVDFPEDVKLPIERNQMATAVLSGNRIKFEYCRLDRAISLLKEQYAVGTVEIRVSQSNF